MVKKSPDFTNIYLLASIMHYDLFGGHSYLFFGKITLVVFSGLR